MSTRERLAPLTSLFLVWILDPLVICHGFVHTVSFSGNPTSSIVTPQPMQRAPSASSQLHMSNGFFLDRVTRVVKSNVNKWVSNMENPEKVINQAVNEMQTDLGQVRQAYAEAVASQRRIQRQLDQAERTANDWYNRAQLALKQQQHQGSHSLSTSHYERLAREALLRRELELERIATIQKQFDTQSVATDQLYNAIVTLENQIREVMSKQQQLVSRARTAEANKQIQSLISGFDTSNIAAAVSNSMNAFARMEQKVEAMEASVEASIELNQMRWSSSFALESSGKPNSKNTVEEEFRMLEQSSKIEEELESLKNQINGRSTSVSSVGAIGPVTTDVSSSLGEQRVISIPVRRGENILIQ